MPPPPETNGLVDGMNRSLEEQLLCITSGDNEKLTEW